MQRFFQAIRSLPEDIRKLLAGLLITIVAFGFFGVWSSFMSSRLVALNPAGQAPAQKPPPPVSGIVRLPPSGGSPLPSQSAENRPPSPAAGIAQTLSGLEKFFSLSPETPDQRRTSRVRTFFAAVGNAVDNSIEFLYVKLSRYVPPNL